MPQASIRRLGPNFIKASKLSKENDRPDCPHCGSTLVSFRMPYEGGWNGEIHWACFNDDCPYFQKGWKWMKEQYEVKASYRYRVNPETGKSSPLPVWSDNALKDRICKDPE